MSDVTQLLSQIDQGDPQAAEKLLPIVYDELRKLAAARLATEQPGQTLQATALVHEAYLRLVGGKRSEVGSQQSEEQSPTSDLRPLTSPAFSSRGHFFAAAAEAMRRILVENARRKARVRHGGQFERTDLPDLPQPTGPEPATILAVDEAVSRLAESDPTSAQLVKLHFFAGLTLDESADALGVSRATAYRLWSYARAFLQMALHDDNAPTPA